MWHTSARVWVVLFVSSVGLGSSAWGQSSAQAEQLFRDGKRLMNEHKYGEACAAFDASQRLEPRTSTAMNLADCNERNGLLATAWGWFLDAAAKTRTVVDATALYDSAIRRAAAIEPRLSHLTIHIRAEDRVDGLVITLDGTVLSEGAWNRAVPMDGGTHTIEARAPDRAPWSAHVAISRERDTKSVDVPLLQVDPSHDTVRRGAATTTAPPSITSSGTAATAVRTSHSRSNVIPLVLGGAAVAAVAAGLALEVSAEHVYDRSTSEPNDVRQRDLYDSAVHRRVAAVGVGAAGVVCGGVAVYFLMRSETDHFALLPTVNGFAIAGVFR